MNKLTKTQLERANKISEYLKVTEVTDANFKHYFDMVIELENLLKKLHGKR